MSYRLHKEGVSYLISAVFFFITTLFFVLFLPTVLSVILLSLSTFLLIMFLIFFRNPLREGHVLGKTSVLAPADGKVVVIEKTKENEFLNSESLQVSIFMSPLNVHINRSPVEGRVVYQKYHPGEYLVAWHPKSSELNERNTLVIQSENSKILIRQIAGKVARKIVSYVKEGTDLKQGEEFGFIKFGSRVDVFLPTDATITVKLGEIVKGGISEIAKLNN